MIKWKKIKSDNLDLDYALIMSSQEADKVLRILEKEVVYFEGDLTKIRIFGKWHQIPRKQVAFGDPGLSYKFSGTTIPAIPWTPTLLELKRKVEEATDRVFNFVLVNRYKDGDDYMGEHKDDEKELDEHSPIVSLSLGAARDFIFRHEDTKKGKKGFPNVKLVLQNGGVLLMNPPSNRFWYHSLPKRKSCRSVRINLTFRKMKKVR